MLQGCKLYVMMSLWLNLALFDYTTHDHWQCTETFYYVCRL